MKLPDTNLRIGMKANTIQSQSVVAGDYSCSSERATKHTGHSMKLQTGCDRRHHFMAEPDIWYMRHNTHTF